ncbi:Vitamin B12 transporter BtuB [Sporomusa rhizae]|uniref:TonB-dependent receptor plug domain-containing protein n=1 Tax=Sporomusa rhizae TaxID=357999 RepID=UPI00352B84BA
MKRNGKQTTLRKGALLTILITASMLSDVGNAAAAQATNPDFTLDQMIVTAQRYEKKDVDIAATADVYTTEDLQNTGAVNLFEALKYMTGIEVQGYGSAGGSMGNMTSKLVIRGVGNGTLVLVNGMPINIRGTYDLSDIPVESVEKVEVIRGGGSVLYGSEATGGVINIITKKERQNYIKTSFGNFNQQDHSVSLQAGKMGIGYQYSKWGTRENAASDGKMWKGPENYNVNLNYRFDDKLSLFYNRIDSSYHYISKTVDTKQDVERNNVQLNYAEDDIKASIYYVDRTRKKNALTYKSGKTSTSIDKEENRNLGFDIQKDWNIGDAKLLFGGSYQDEEYTPSGESEHSRNNFSAYTQYEKPLSKQNTLILSARESWTTGAPNDLNTTNFSGQGQFIHKLGNEENLYLNIGQSYKMPYLHQIYKTKEGAALKAQTGMHYEIGWKKNTEDHRWRVALFNYAIKDNISAAWNDKTGDFIYNNEDLKNTGIELSCDISGKNGWTYNWGVSYSDPQTKTIENGKSSGWVRDYARLQMNGGATYKSGKWRSSLNATYLGERATTGIDVKPYLLTNLNVNYSVTKNSDIFLSVSNILDRDDIMYSSGSTDYYIAPCNFLLGYKQSF